MKRIVIVNAGPRKGWNTDILLNEAAKGAEAAGKRRSLSKNRKRMNSAAKWRNKEKGQSLKAPPYIFL